MSEELENQEINLKTLILNVIKLNKLILSKWKIVLIYLIIGLTIGYLYAKDKKSQYISELTFIVEDDNGLSSDNLLASTIGVELGGKNKGMYSGENLIELLKSRKMIEKTLLASVPYKKKIITLVEYYIIEKKLRLKWNENKKIKNIEFKPNKQRCNFSFEEDSILGTISEQLKTELIISQKNKKSSILTIEISSTNELFAKYFTELLTTIVAKEYIENKSKKAKINMLILQKQTDSVRNELNNAISGVAIANDNTFNLNPALNVHKIPSARREVDIQANNLILSELIKQLEISKVTLRDNIPLFEIIDKPILPLKSKKIGKLKSMILAGFLFVIISFSIIIIKNKISKLNLFDK